MTAHLQLMSKQRLIQIVAAAEKRARQHAELADYWRGVTSGLIDTAPKPDFVPSPETTLMEARRILRSLPRDPLAEEHRDTLRAELNLRERPVGSGAKRKPGPRCDRNSCDQRLNEFGLCSRCQHGATKRARAEATA
jgi:hypothetical protein